MREYLRGLSNRITIKEFVTKYKIKTVVCCLSGGKDSLAATHFTCTNLADSPITIRVAYVDTTVALPGVKDYVVKVAKEFGWPLVTLRPKEDFFSLAAKRGMPTRRGRWCCYNLKLEPLIAYTKKLAKPRVQITGMRATESTRRSLLVSKGEIYQLMWRNIGKHFLYSPTFWWSNEEVKKYIKKHSLPINPAYDLIGSSGECVCGVYLNLKNLCLIRDTFPTFFQKFVALEEEFRNGGSAFYDYKNKERIYASTLVQQK